MLKTMVARAALASGVFQFLNEREPRQSGREGVLAYKLNGWIPNNLQADEGAAPPLSYAILRSTTYCEGAVLAPSRELWIAKFWMAETQQFSVEAWGGVGKAFCVEIEN